MTMTGAEHDAMLAVRDHLAAALANVMTERAHRDQIVLGDHGLELAWVIHERQTMLAAVNAHRRERGLPEVDEDTIWRIEESAAGHVDYAAKFALRAAMLAVGAEQVR